MSTLKVGIVGFSFGLREAADEPGTSNFELGRTLRNLYRGAITKGMTPIVVSQWEITKALSMPFMNVPVDHSVEALPGNEYLDSKGVWREAKRVFEQEGVTKVIIVGQPFLHLFMLRRMVQRDGFEVVKTSSYKIPFDASKFNTQWWTKSRLALVLYTIKYIIKAIFMSGRHGHGGKQNAN